jgi:flagellum-specific peptidoglycan hydrolase FlgJ
MIRITFFLIFICLVTKLYAPEIPGEVKWDLEKYLRHCALTPENLLQALKFNQVVSPEIVLSQAILETGHFKSKICIENNNLFGMRRSRARLNKCSGITQNGYATYRSWYDCIMDMKLFQQWYLSKGRDLSDYFVFLMQIGYAEDPGYMVKLRKLYII